MDWLRHRLGFQPRAVYHLPEFWNQAYVQRQRERFEWAGVGLRDLADYEYVDVSMHRSADGGRRLLADDVPFDAKVLIVGSGEFSSVRRG